MNFDLYPLMIVGFGIYSLAYGAFLFDFYGINGLLFGSLFYVFSGIIGVKYKPKIKIKRGK